MSVPTRATKGAFLLRQLRRRARLQAGVFTVRQAASAGVTHATIRAQVEAGRCTRLHHGVYLLGNMAPDGPALRWAAVLAAGPGAVISHETAAFGYGFIKRAPELVHVSIPAHRVVRPLAGVRLRRSRHPSPVVTAGGEPPVTAPADTVLDLISGFRSAQDVIALLTDAIRTGRVDAPRIVEAMQNRPRQRHRQLIADALNDVVAGVDSVLEYRYLTKVERAHDLPIGSRQVRTRLRGRVVAEDVEYEEYQTVVELDGRLGHEASGRHRDRRRDNANTLRHRTTLRYGYADLCEPCDVASEVAAVLRERGWAGSPRACGPRCAVG